MIFYRNLQEITFRVTNVIPERIIFVSRGITVYILSINPPPLDMLHVAGLQYLMFLISFLQFVTDVTSVDMF